jgi:hypothetical protein
MLARLKKILWPFSANSLQDRRIFEFSDGSRDRREDPAIILQRLKSHPTFNLKVEAVLVDEGELDAKHRTADAVCEIFQVQRFNGETGLGLTTHELIALLMQFISWMDTLKKNTSGLQMPLQPTDSTLSENNDPSATKLDSESSSTPSASTSESQQSSSELLTNPEAASQAS